LSRTTFLRTTRVFLFLLLARAIGLAQSLPEAPYFAHRQSLGIVAQYSNDSSHILIGQAEEREILNLGISYSHRLWLGRIVNWQYDAQFFPLAFESDPLAGFVTMETSPEALTSTVYNAAPLVKCGPQTSSYSYTYSGVTYAGTQTSFCSGRRWTIGQGFSPIGMQWNFRPRSWLQPFVAGHGGYLYSTRPVPILAAGSFNFTFDLGAGVEIYRTHAQSIRLEYLFHHISDAYTSEANPGIDNGVLQFTYVFGR
jgi:hypothetical protein